MASDIPPIRDPPIQHPLSDDLVPAFGDMVQRLSRKERRAKFWNPIHTKIRQKQERRQDHQMTATAQNATDTAGFGRHGQNVEAKNVASNISNRRQVPPRPPQCGDNPRSQQFGYGHAEAHSQACDAIHAYMPAHGAPHAPIYGLDSRVFLHPGFVNAQIHGGLAQPRTESQSSATQLGDDTGLPTTMQPRARALDCSSLDATKLRKEIDDLEHSVRGIAPDTPSRPGLGEFQQDHDLELWADPLELAAAIPDHASSEFVPRLHIYDWDAKTAVPEVKGASAFFISSKALIDELCTDTKVKIGNERSWTWPGREMDLITPCASPSLFETGNSNGTLVDEPEEVLPKGLDVEEVPPSADDSVENFSSVRQGVAWVEFG